MYRYRTRRAATAHFSASLRRYVPTGSKPHTIMCDRQQACLCPGPARVPCDEGMSEGFRLPTSDFRLQFQTFHAIGLRYRVGGRVIPSPAIRRLTACVIAGCVGHASVHCDSGPRAWGPGERARARARCVFHSSSRHFTRRLKEASPKSRYSSTAGPGSERSGGITEQRI